MLYINQVCSLFCIVRVYKSLHPLPTLFVKLDFRLYLFLLFVFLYHWFLVFSFSVLGFEFI